MKQLNYMNSTLMNTGIKPDANPVKGFFGFMEDWDSERISGESHGN